ncbi:MAG: phosphate signaling complex protein PhoU [Actinobacteria bacterium]|nr:phosphate signaling complex protein PhoU [Actinomycetota bacterium]
MVERTRRAFDRELAELETDILCAAGLVVEALATAGEALATHDPDLATKVVHGHADIDRATHRCETRAYEVLARQQPAAGDLRFVLTVVRLSHELERSAKLVRHVASFAARPHGYLPPRLAGLVARMAEEARRLLQGAIDAYAERDVERAEALDIWDDRMDELHRQLLAELFSAPQSLATTLELALVGRYLERIADHAVLIGDRVRYLVRAEL